MKTVLEDSQDLHQIMGLTWLDIPHKREVTEFYLTGAAFIGTSLRLSPFKNVFTSDALINRLNGQ